MAKKKDDHGQPTPDTAAKDAGASGEQPAFQAAPVTMGSHAAPSPGAQGALERVPVRKAYKMYVGGAFVRSESGRYTQVTEAPGLSAKENVSRASRKDGRDAVKAAQGAWSGWNGRTAFNRGQILYRLGEMMEARKGELVTSLVNGGLSREDAERETLAAIDRAIAYAGWCDKYQSLFASLNPVAGPHFNFTTPESMGVVTIVAPERPALLGLVGSILPVIASGNTCVVLASEADPRTAIVFSEALATSDMPGGVVNILTGPAKEVLPHLAKHLEVAALDLHGVDPALAKAVEEAAVINVKRVRARSLAPADWFDAAKAESPRWIERFVEMKTIWHPAGP